MSYTTEKHGSECPPHGHAKEAWYWIRLEECPDERQDGRCGARLLAVAARDLLIFPALSNTPSKRTIHFGAMRLIYGESVLLANKNTRMSSPHLMTRQANVSFSWRITIQMLRSLDVLVSPV